MLRIHSADVAEQPSSISPVILFAPDDAGRVDVVFLFRPPRLISIPGEVNLADGAEFPRAENIASFFEVRHVSLLGADLDNSFVLVLSSNDGGAFADSVRQRLFDVYIFASITRIDGHRYVPVIHQV